MNIIANTASIISTSIQSPTSTSILFKDTAEIMTEKEFDRRREVQINEIESTIDSEFREVDSDVTDDEYREVNKDHIDPEDNDSRSNGDERVFYQKVNSVVLINKLEKITHDPKNTAFINPTFKLVFLVVFGITLISGIGDFYIALAWPTPTGNQQSVFEALGFTWKAGVGAIFGLIGGKVG